MVVLPWCREETGPLREEGLLDPLHQGGVGVILTDRGGTVGAGETRCESIIGIQDSLSVKGMVL